MSLPRGEAVARAARERSEQERETTTVTARILACRLGSWAAVRVFGP